MSSSSINGVPYRSKIITLRFSWQIQSTQRRFIYFVNLELKQMIENTILHYGGQKKERKNLPSNVACLYHDKEMKSSRAAAQMLLCFEACFPTLSYWCLSFFYLWPEKKIAIGIIICTHSTSLSSHVVFLEVSKTTFSPPQKSMRHILKSH